MTDIRLPGLHARVEYLQNEIDAAEESIHDMLTELKIRKDEIKEIENGES